MAGVDEHWGKVKLGVDEPCGKVVGKWMEMLL